MTARKKWGNISEMLKDIKDVRPQKIKIKQILKNT